MSATLRKYARRKTSRLTGLRAELEEHTAEHARIQQVLRRHGGRTYGSRLANDSPGISSQESILPVANSSGTALSSAISLESVMPSTATSQAVDDTRNRLARFMNKDAEYLIFRRFSSMNTSNILRLQTELTELEKQLAAETENGLASPLQDLIEARLLAYSKSNVKVIVPSNLGSNNASLPAFVRRSSNAIFPTVQARTPRTRSAVRSAPLGVAQHAFRDNRARFS